jgi:hypothetical protein
MSVQRKTSAVLLSVLLLVPLITAGCAKKGSVGPAVIFENEIFSFGEVVEGDDASYSFSFSNPGTEILIINDLHLSCWCITVDEFDRVVEPGGSGVIAGVIKTNGFEGDMVKTISVKTNIRDKEPVLSVEGIVIAKNNIEILPLPLVFGDIHDRKTTLAGEVMVRCLSDYPFRIERITAPGLTTEAHLAVVTEEKEYRVVITVHPPLARGIVDETVTLHTNLPDMPEISVPYMYHMIP